ncbi:SDR family oxidoreductase [uncultured Meiothermus sp.]|jgi:short-subunit dehydrogenase|uniref:SDR family NAD(P)-dependent oxidoreductase n=1 Tax=uncultured Meiothermus sp. TaxID=157471 RepID=UPI00262CB87B|nr:SDR family oxidoreductase [uncultured Meiothermus sp.]
MSTQGNVALITGASSGIGEELARVFATYGFHLVLVARTEPRLQELAHTLRTQHHLQAFPIALDLSDPQGPARLQQKVLELGLTVDVLVNNAGFADFGEFARSDLAKQTQMIQLNITTLTELTHRFLPAMMERRRGYVLNVASTAAFMPGPLMSVYYATKAYVLSFSEAIREELKGSGVSVTALCPGPVATGFQSRAEMAGSRLLTNPLNPPTSPDKVAQAGYKALMRGQQLVIPGFVNQLQALAPRLLPRAMVPGMVRNAAARSH